MLNLILLLGYGVINLAGFITMGIDKRRAKRNQYRIKEKTLWLLAWLGGAIGTTIGMNFFRHKTKHTMFKFGMPVLAFIQVVLISLLLMKYLSKS